MHVYTEADQPLAALPGIEHRTLAGSAAGLKHLSVWRQSIAGGAATPGVGRRRGSGPYAGRHGGV